MSAAARTGANSARGECSLTVNGTDWVLRPSFTALVAAEEELGSLFSLVERASQGQLRIAEITALFWHCLADKGELTRDEIGEAVVSAGLASVSAQLRVILRQVLQGQT